MKGFGDYKGEGHKWITLADIEYYPDILEDASHLYGPIIHEFGEILSHSKDSIALFLNLNREKDGKKRVQFARIFRKYASPNTPVEMLKKKTKAREICDQFGSEFREIDEVRHHFSHRPQPDEALCAVLWEYKDRGKKGYDLTSKFFSLFREHYPQYRLTGPERAGKDIRMGELFRDYPKKDRPVDFVIWNEGGPIAIGLARYDSDRGGAQEDDRTGGYMNCANEILSYSRDHGIDLKVIFLNDGPGLLLGSMWDDYTYLENSWQGKIMVITLKMMKERLTQEWLES